MKQISKSVGTSQDIPKNHEYGPSSENRPSGKRGYSSSGRARTTHLKEVKRTANKQRRATDIIVRDSDRVGYPVAIGKMLPRILARIAGKS